MPGDSKIEWTEATWNPTTGCTKVSPGCAHCYAETLTARYAGSPGWPAAFKPWVPGNDTVVLHPDRLDAPLRWRTPRRVFVDSMSDLFHEDIPFEYIDRVFAVMALTPQHTYQVLTKRPARMREYVGWVGRHNAIELAAPGQFLPGLPFPNVWLGVTVENQHWADERIPILLDTPAAVRFLSCEPMLGPIDLSGDFAQYSENGLYLRETTGYFEPHVWALGKDAISWVIVGGESGSKHRPFDPDWARSIVAQCREAGVAPFVKQLGGARPGNKLEDLPPDLQVREFPR